MFCESLPYAYPQQGNTTVSPLTSADSTSSEATATGLMSDLYYPLSAASSFCNDTYDEAPVCSMPPTSLMDVSLENGCRRYVEAKMEHFSPLWEFPSQSPRIQSSQHPLGNCVPPLIQNSGNMVTQDVVVPSLAERQASVSQRFISLSMDITSCAATRPDHYRLNSYSTIESVMSSDPQNVPPVLAQQPRPHLSKRPNTIHCPEGVELFEMNDEATFSVNSLKEAHHRAQKERSSMERKRKSGYRKHDEKGKRGSTLLLLKELYEQRGPDLITNKGITCDCCNGHFNSFTDLAKHVDQMKHVRDSYCPDETCSYSVIGFRRRVSLRRHICEDHLKEYNFRTRTEITASSLIGSPEDGISPKGSSCRDGNASDGLSKLRALLDEVYVCDDPSCLRAFYRLDSLLRHQRCIHHVKLT